MLGGAWICKHAITWRYKVDAILWAKCERLVTLIYWIDENYRVRGRAGRGRRHYWGSSLYTHGPQHWWDIKVITNGKIGRATAEEATHRDLLAVLHISYDPPSNDDYGCIKTPSNRLPTMGICTGFIFIYVFYSLVGNSALARTSEAYIMDADYLENYLMVYIIFHMPDRCYRESGIG